MPGVYKRGNAWYYYFNTAKVGNTYKKICRKGRRTKVDAEKALRMALNEYENTGNTKMNSNISVIDYFKYWLENHVKINLKLHTYNAYEGVVKRHINKDLGNYKLKSLTPNILQEFLNNKKLNGYTKNGISNFYGVLSGALKMAVHPYELIKENPMTYVSMPKFNTKKSDEEMATLTMDEVNKILDRFPMGSSFYIVVQIAFYTGLRAGEVGGLTWDNINFQSKTLTVEKSLLKRGPIWEFDTPKTDSSNRTIKIGDSLISILKRHQKWQKENQLRYGKYYTKTEYSFHGKIYKTTDLISTKENGQLISTESLKYLSKVINYDLGINFHFHILRHTHATMLLENGAKPKDIQERLGHSKLATTMDTYSHVTDKMKQDTVCGYIRNFGSKKIITTNPFSLVVNS